MKSALYLTLMMIMLTGCVSTHTTNTPPPPQEGDIGYVTSGPYYPLIHTYPEHGGFFTRGH